MKENALYLEADEDITSAIDKLQKLAGDSAQIVVPKRSTLLQSVINLKLLKKAAADYHKELVLVTNDRIAADLAARVGLAVAPSLGAKAIMASNAAPAPSINEDIIEEADPEPLPPAPEPVVQTSKPKLKRPFFARKPVAEGASSAPVELAAGAGLGAGGAATADEPAADTPAKSALPKVKVPDFNRLQQRLLWVGLAAFLVVGYVAAMYFLSSAKVTLFASGTKIDIDTSFSADPNLKQSDMDKGVLAAQTVSFSKDLSGPFTATGKRDVGTKATGSVTVYNEYDTNAHTLVAGTRFQSPDGKVFRTKSDVVVPGAAVGLKNGQFVLTPGKSDPVAVEADQNGDSYNQAPARYIIPGYAGDMQAKIYGQGAQMNGGTSKVITVVTQADIDKAKSELLSQDKDTVQKDLEDKAPTGYRVLAGSEQQNADAVTASPALDQEASSAKLTVKVNYSQLAVLKKDFEELIRAQEQKQIGDANQIYDDGLDAAKLTLGDRDSTGRQSFHIATQAYGGARLDEKVIAAQIKGKKYGEAIKQVTSLPGIQRAEINLWPVWSTGLPGRPDKIKVTIQVAGVTGEDK